MEDRLCYNCGNKILKSDKGLEIEVICPSCRHILYLGREHLEVGLRGKSFQKQALDHSCKKCGRFQCRSVGLGSLEVKCKYCKEVTKHNTTDIREGRIFIRNANSEICL